MKKIIIAILTLSIISCGSDDHGNDAQYQSKNRIRKLIDKTYDSDYILNFGYNGDVYQCYSIRNAQDEYFINYYYENNRLVKSFRNNSEYDYTYENGTISQVEISFGNTVNEKFKYFYNSENQLIKSEGYANNNGSLELLDYTLYFYDNNGNNYRSEFYTATSNLRVYEINTFDDKNNIFKNFEPKITLMEYNPFGNNITSKTLHYVELNHPPEVTTYIYEYNSNGYPIKSTINYPNNETTYRAEYEYD